MSNKIRELRKLNNMTQEELGEKIGIKKSAVAKYESGDIENIKKATVEKIADVFGVSPAYVFGWSDGSDELTADEKSLMEMYGRLNDMGRREAQRRVNDLTTIPLYTIKSVYMPVAAHSDGVETEDLQKDIEKVKRLFGDMIRGDEFGV